MTGSVAAHLQIDNHAFTQHWKRMTQGNAHTSHSDMGTTEAQL